VVSMNRLVAALLARLAHQLPALDEQVGVRTASLQLFLTLGQLPVPRPILPHVAVETLLAPTLPGPGFDALAS